MYPKTNGSDCRDTISATQHENARIESAFLPNDKNTHSCREIFSLCRKNILPYLGSKCNTFLKHKDWTLTPTLQPSPFGSLSAGVGCRKHIENGITSRFLGFRPWTRSACPGFISLIQMPKRNSTTFVVLFLFGRGTRT